MGLSGFAERLFAGRWIAGPHTSDAIARARELNGMGIKAIINYLGEGVKDREAVDRVMETYAELIGEVGRSGVRADISVKPTELGMLVDRKLLYSNYRTIVRRAKRRGIFVWIDMEESKYVTETIKLYESMAGSGNTGICVQSYLKRSAADLKELHRHSSTVRLVKGAYGGTEKEAYQNRRDTTDNYYRLMPYLFANFRRFTIATHDTDIIETAVRMNRKHRRDVTYAMLTGIRMRYAAELARREKVSVYVPFGEQWIKYSYRRIKELSNFILITRSLFGG